MRHLYQVGGDLKPSNPTYVRRQADQQLEQLLELKEYCYILNCRQTGKSSLAVHIDQNLLNKGYACVLICLQEIGIGVTIDQWYATIIKLIADQLEIEINYHWFDEKMAFSPVARLKAFIEEILLQEIKQNIIIFIDELDTILSLNFPADDLLGLIRSCYNNRASQPEYERLSFVLLGVAAPSDLIKDKTKTPFNIGHKIDLQGFKLEEVTPLLEGLQDKADQPRLVIKEILFWTGGQPFLTQKVCQLVSESEDYILAGEETNKIATLVKDKIINNWRNQDHPQHLKTIEDRIYADSDNLVNLLETYRKILAHDLILASDINAEILLKLRLSGLVAQKGSNVQVTNEIYKRVFNEEWINNKAAEIRPYALLMDAWFASNCLDRTQLMRGQILKNVLNWSKDKNLGNQDYKYLNACQTSQNKRKIRNILLTAFGVGIGILSSWLWYDYKYASCTVGERIIEANLQEAKCFRTVITSGEEHRLFISKNNFDLVRGSQYFKSGEYAQAILYFEQAIYADPSNPTAQIYLNNTKARLQGNPLKIAASIPIDYFEDTAQQILRGIADAQTNFNKNNGKNGRFLEIIIANDGNEETATKWVSKKLANQSDILAIIGHDSSESSQIALPVYEKKNLAMVSATSTSSQLKSPVFFRTVAPTTEAAKSYSQYIKNHLGLDKVIIIYDPDSLYSSSLKDDFSQEFSQLGGKIELVSLNQNPLDIQYKINHAILNNIQFGFLIPSVKTDSLATAVARKNPKMKFFQEKDLTHNPKGIILSGPCLAKQSQYTQQAIIRWSTDITATTTAGYDATQAIIEAIKLSSDNPTREEILNHLKSLTLPIHKTSGFGLEWSRTNPLDHFNIKQKYCIYNSLK